MLSSLTRLTTLLAVSCLGTGALLLAGRALLALQAPLTPASDSARLEHLRRWSPDPERRREAALLLHSRFADDPALQRTLLRGHGWGNDPLAAVVLRQEAHAAEALGDPGAAERLWKTLQHRFPGDPASADALYALGRDRPALRQELLRRFPAHPAALAAALEAGPEPAERLAGTLHLARWGARWPGAEERLRRACAEPAALNPASRRALIAGALAEVGAAEAAVRCLEGPPAAWETLSDAGRLSLARALLRGDAAGQQRATGLLLALASRPGSSPADAGEAVRLLAQQEGPAAAAALAALPPRWQDSAPVAAHRVLADPGGRGGLEVLRRWPDDPASWELQWELARRRLLAGDWQAAQTLLEAIPAGRLPPPLAARQRFWIGYSQRQLGQGQKAAETWQQLRQTGTGGYYDWRAAVQLGEAEERALLTPSRPSPTGAERRWDPLASGDPGLDRLWRLDQRNEAWEQWRTQRRGQAPRGGAELLVEGRLRQGVGDDWTGFAQLEQAALRLGADRCDLLPALQRSLHPPRFEAVLRPWAQRRQVPLALLQGVAKQESRFSPTVRSSAGAVGLMQVLPSTATELAGRPVSAADLEDPGRNAALGSLYLSQLLSQAGGDPLVAVAGYNAGPGAVAGWISPQLRQAPELWVETIPYPETRLYVKKVLGNTWSYASPVEPRC